MPEKAGSLKTWLTKESGRLPQIGAGCSAHAGDATEGLRQFYLILEVVAPHATGTESAVLVVDAVDGDRPVGASSSVFAASVAELCDGTGSVFSGGAMIGAACERSPVGTGVSATRTMLWV